MRSTSVSMGLFIALCKQAALPVPELEYRFAKPRLWRFDVAWPAEKIALEVEGGVWTNGRHTRASGYVKDLEKYNRAAVLGWRLLRVTPNRLADLGTLRMVADSMGRVLPAGWLP